MGGIDDWPKNYIEKTFNNNFYMHSLTDFYTIYDHSKKVCLKKNVSIIIFLGKSEESF